MIRNPLARASLVLFPALAFAASVACSPAADSDGAGTTTGDGDGATPGGDGDSSGDGDSGGDGDLDVTPVGDGDGDGPRMTECAIDPVTMEEVCTCIKLATWGALGQFGAVIGMDGTDAITEWLNANSTGDAEYFATKPAITAELLAGFDVIILQDLSGWAAFTAEEIATFDAWVNEGGGAISLNGYSNMGDEMTNVNALLASSGMSYIPTLDTSTPPVDVGCTYCYGSSVPQAGWVATHPISPNLTQVGAFYGRGITAGDGEVVAQTADGVVGATKQLGLGRIFMFHDEWVTYNSQWTGAGLPNDCRTEDVNATCYNKHPSTDYSSAQFWFNSIKWVAGDIACFDIDDVTIVK